MKNIKTSNTTRQQKKIGIFSATTGKRKRTFAHQIDAAKFLGCTQANICYALGGKLKTCKGHIVRWCDSETKEVNPAVARHAKKATRETKNPVKKAVKKCAKKIALFSVKTGKKNRVFQTAAEAAKFLGVNPSNVCRALSGEHSSCKNYTLKYV